MNFLKRLFNKKQIQIWNVGDIINPFQMTTHTGQEYIYNTKSRTKLLIFFFPNAWSDTNRNQIAILEKNYNRFLRFNITPIGVTTDTPASLKKWAKTLSIRNIRILSDFWPHGYLTNLFGILNRQRGCPEKYVIMIDDDLKVLLKRKLKTSINFDIEDIFSFIKNKNEQDQKQEQKK